MRASIPKICAVQATVLGSIEDRSPVRRQIFMRAAQTQIRGGARRPVSPQAADARVRRRPRRWPAGRRRGCSAGRSLGSVVGCGSPGRELEQCRKAVRLLLEQRQVAAVVPRLRAGHVHRLGVAQVTAHHRDDVHPFDRRERRAFECCHSRLHPAGLTGPHRASADGDAGEPRVLLPARRQGACPAFEARAPAPLDPAQVGRLADGVLDHHGEQVRLPRHVPIERHLGEVEALGHALHRDAVDAFGVGDQHRGSRDLVDRQGGLGPAGRQGRLPQSSSIVRVGCSSRIGSAI